jgi:hypothetical protein
MDRDVPFGGELLVNDHDRKVYDFLTAPERLGRLFVMPGKVAPDRIAALRTAFDAMVADAAFLAEAQRSGTHGHADDRQRGGSRDRRALRDPGRYPGARPEHCRRVKRALRCYAALT